MRTELAIYVRSHPAHAWRYGRYCAFKEAAELERDTNKAFGVETLLVPWPGNGVLPVFIDSNQTQGEIGG